MSLEPQKLIQLPNGDLWRGRSNDAEQSVDNVAMDKAPRPFAKIDEAMAAIMKAAKGGKQFSCTWCGFQTDASDAKSMREHLKASHPSVVNPPTDEQLALAAKINSQSVTSG